MRNKLTIQELARKAKVSVATVSRALNPETRAMVTPETCQGIDALAKKYHYTPNLAAKHLRQTAYRTIGILFPHHEGIFLSEYYTQILAGISDYLLGSDYAVKMILLKPEKPKWDTYDFKDGEAVDGLIVTYWRTFFSDASVLAKLNLPCVIVSNAERNVRARFVGGDHYQGGRLAAEYLYSQGHRKIAVMTGSGGAPDAEQRFAGFKSYWAEKKVVVSVNSIFDAHFNEDEAYQLTETLLKKCPKVTAVFCMNDTLAFGVLKKLKELGVDCPGQLSVMGYDDDLRAVASEPPLTTIRVPVYSAAKQAAADLIDCLKNKDVKKFYRRELLPTQLIERASVRTIG